MSSVIDNFKTYAFNACTALSSIQIPNSVTSIGDRAFAGCVPFIPIKFSNIGAHIGKDAFTAADKIDI